MPFLFALPFACFGAGPDGAAAIAPAGALSIAFLFGGNPFASSTCQFFNRSAVSSLLPKSLMSRIHMVRAW